MLVATNDLKVPNFLPMVFSICSSAFYAAERLVLQEIFLKPKIHGLYMRAASNREWLIMALVRYVKRNMNAPSENTSTHFGVLWNGSQRKKKDRDF